MRYVPILILLTTLLAGCASEGVFRAPQRETEAQPANAPPEDRETVQEKRRAVQALKSSGIDENNLVYWRQMAVEGCGNLKGYPLPQDDPATVAPVLEREFGPVADALRLYFVVANQTEGHGLRLPSVGWNFFAAGFNSFKQQMEQNRKGAASLQEDFVAMVGGTMGALPRWQFWVADRFNSGLTLRSFVATGREFEQLILEHWKEVDANRYSDGNTRKVFGGNGWQPKGWATENRRAADALAKFLTVLADPTLDAATRGSRAVEVLSDFRRDQTLSGTASRPTLCEAKVKEGLYLIQTPEDYRRYDREVEQKAQRKQPGKKGTKTRSFGGSMFNDE